MSNIFIFDPITIDLPINRIYKRLGFVSGKTMLDSSRKKEIDQYIQAAMGFIELKGAACRKPIAASWPNRIGLSEKEVFTGKYLSSWLIGCKEVLVMAATSGLKIINEISSDTQGKNVTRGVVFDAVASEVTDSGLDWIMDFFKSQLRRENKALDPKRFSPGFSDFTLSNQMIIYEILELNRLGLELTPSCMLTPEKSVTALAGIK